MSPLHTQSDKSGSRLSGEAWGKGVRLSRVPSGAVLYLVLKSGRPPLKWARIPGLELGSSGPLIYLAELTSSAPAHLARSQAERRSLREPHPWRLRLGPPSLPPPAARSLRLSCSLVGTRSISRSSLHSGPHFGSSLASSSGPQSSGLHSPSRSCPPPAPAPGLSSRTLKAWLVPSLVCCPPARGSGSWLWLELGL